uniref:Uncharacterized protein n=1 Tax=Oryza sativa subsp. japonica TaxID=39947 RepID=Q6K3N9_ORYSJ|nr:hypothetical protein [Oryza sativa Japonica Group]
MPVLGAVQAIIVDPEEIAAAEQLHESPSPTKLCQSCLASREPPFAAGELEIDLSHG